MWWDGHKQIESYIGLFGHAHCVLLIDKSHSVHLPNRLAIMSWPGKADVPNWESFIKILKSQGGTMAKGKLTKWGILKLKKKIIVITNVNNVIE